MTYSKREREFTFTFGKKYAFLNRPKEFVIHLGFFNQRLHEFAEREKC